MRVKLILMVIFLAVAVPAYPQAKPAAVGSRTQFTIGAGFSDYYSDWNGRYDGTTMWFDWNPSLGPSLFHGLGLEIEARDLSFGKTGSVPHLRLDTVSGGAIYTIRHYRSIHPYAKFLMGYASFDFQPIHTPQGVYSHDSRTVYTPGGGVEYRLGRNVWVRGDYEYQFFVDFSHHHAMNPNGFTIGVSYDLAHLHRAHRR